MSDRRADLPISNTERPKTDETQGPNIDPNRLQTAIPLLTEVVVPGHALAEAAKTTSVDTASTRAEDTHRAEQELLERLIPTVGALLERSVYEALSRAGHQIVSHTLTQLQQRIVRMPEEAATTSIPQAPEKS